MIISNCNKIGHHDKENTVARKKKTDKDVIDEVSKLTAEITLTDTENWPKITKGSHTTITEHQNGRVEMTWDWEQLNRDINNAIWEFVNSNSSQTRVSENDKKPRAKTSRKKGSKNELV